MAATNFRQVSSKDALPEMGPVIKSNFIFNLKKIGNIQILNINCF